MLKATGWNNARVWIYMWRIRDLWGISHWCINKSQEVVNSPFDFSSSSIISIAVTFVVNAPFPWHLLQSLSVLGAINWRWDFHPHAQVAVVKEKNLAWIPCFTLMILIVRLVFVIVYPESCLRCGMQWRRLQADMSFVSSTQTKLWCQVSLWSRLEIERLFWRFRRTLSMAT